MASPNFPNARIAKATRSSSSAERSTRSLAKKQGIVKTVGGKSARAIKHGIRAKARRGK